MQADKKCRKGTQKGILHFLHIRPNYKTFYNVFFFPLPLEGHSRVYVTIFSPLEDHPKMHLITFLAYLATMKGTLSSTTCTSLTGCKIANI